MLYLFLVRHGQTEWNQGSSAGEHFRGRLDIALNPTGVAQAQSVADRLAASDIRAVYASPLQRALHTAAPIARAHDLSPQAFQGLLDIDYGQWSGKSHRQVAQELPDLYRQIRDGNNNHDTAKKVTDRAEGIPVHVSRLPCSGRVG